TACIERPVTGVANPCRGKRRKPQPLVLRQDQAGNQQIREDRAPETITQLDPSSFFFVKRLLQLPRSFRETSLKCRVFSCALNGCTVQRTPAGAPEMRLRVGCESTLIQTCYQS